MDDTTKTTPSPVVTPVVNDPPAPVVPTAEPVVEEPKEAADAAEVSTQGGADDASGTSTPPIV